MNIFRYFNKREKYILIVLSLLICLFVTSKILNPAILTRKIIPIGINDIERFNNQLSKFLIALIIVTGVMFLYLSSNTQNILMKYKDFLSLIYNYSKQIFSLKSLLLLCSLYLVILFYYAVTRYDLGIDEAVYVMYAKSFYLYHFPFCTINGAIYDGQFVLTDNYAMLPLYIFSVIPFMLNLTEVWHFKLLCSLLSVISLVIIAKIIQKEYGLTYSIIFVFLVIIQPGFGFVASSFFGEIVEAVFIFGAVYVWFKNNDNISTKKILIISMLFALAAQTKFQLIPSLTISLVIFQLVSKQKHPIKILVFFLLSYLIISFLRLIPALIYDKTILWKIIKYWFLTLSSTKTSLIFNIQRLELLNRLSSILFISLVLSFSYFYLKTQFDKFIYIFTYTYILFYVFFFPFTTYRHLMMGIIPLMFLASLLVVNLYEKLISENRINFEIGRSIITFVILLLMLWGFSTNIIYAFIGYNDGVQFDLDGNKNRLFNSIEPDRTQKLFYNEVKNLINQKDSIYIGGGGEAIFTSQFYLSNYTIYDFEHFKTTLDSSSTKKYLIIDRVSFPLGLEPGRKLLDSLKVNKQLLLKEGDFELYSVSKQ